MMTRILITLCILLLSHVGYAQQVSLSLKSAIGGENCAQNLNASGALSSAQKIDGDLGKAWKQLGLPEYKGVFVDNYRWVEGVCQRDQLNLYPCVTLVLDNLQKRTDSYIRTNHKDKMTPAADKVLPIFVLANSGASTRKACEGLYALCKKGQGVDAGGAFQTPEARSKAAECITLNMMNIVYTDNINNWTKLTAESIVKLLK